jgi:hypothetical protein
MGTAGAAVRAAVRAAVVAGVMLGGGSARAGELVEGLHAQAVFSEVAPVSVGLRLGEGLNVKALVGMNPFGAQGAVPRWTLGAGVGMRFGLGPFSLDVDVLGHTVRSDLLQGERNLLGQARAVLGFRLGPVGVLAGPTANLLGSLDGERYGALGLLPGATPAQDTRLAASELPAPDGRRLTLRGWPGFVVGVEL